jgi:AcrR family transcriptional regulator
MHAQSLSRRQREKLRQRQEMMDAALILFAEKGYHNVSMQEIAEQAEFAIGTIYKFFPTKADLYETIVLQQLDAFDEALDRAINSTDDEVQKLRCYVQTKEEAFRRKLSFVRLFVAESRAVSFNIKDGLAEAVQSRYQAFLERLAFIFESGIQSKRFKPIASPFKMAVALDTTVNAFLLLWLDAPEAHPFPEHPDDILNIFFKALIDP